MKPIIYALILFCLTGRVNGQSPHGGQLKVVGAFKIEVVNCAGYLEIYLYTLNMQSIRNHALSGHVDFHYPDGSCVTEQLYHYSNDSFTAETEIQSYTSCEVFICATGLSLRAKFDDLVCRMPDDEDHLNK